MKLLITTLMLFIATTSFAANAKKTHVKEAAPEVAAAVETTTADANAPASEISDEDLAQAAQWLEKADKEDAKLGKIAPAPALTEDEQKELANRKESEIPVLATKVADNSDKKSASSSRILLSLGLVLGLLFGFSFFMKKFMKRAPTKKNSQIKILTQHYLGPKKSLAIIRVAGESMLVGITDQNINLIKTLALLDEEIPQDTPKNFSTSLSKSMNEANTENVTNEFSVQDDEAEEFSFSKIKDFVSGRLKNMKEI